MVPHLPLHFFPTPGNRLFCSDKVRYSRLKYQTNQPKTHSIQPIFIFKARLPHRQGPEAVIFAFGLPVMAMAYRIDGISGCHTPGPHTRLMAPGRMSDKDAADTTSPGNSPGHRSARPAYDRCRTANARTGIALRPTERPPGRNPFPANCPQRRKMPLRPLRGKTKTGASAKAPVFHIANR